MKTLENNQLRYLDNQIIDNLDSPEEFKRIAKVNTKSIANLNYLDDIIVDTVTPENYKPLTKEI